MKENVSLEKENSKNKIKTRTKDEEEAEEAFYLKSNTSREIRIKFVKKFLSAADLRLWAIKKRRNRHFITE